MSTDLKSRSKAYDLTRVACTGELGVVVGQGWNKPAVTLTESAIQSMFVAKDFSNVQNALNLLDETMPLLKQDLYQFIMTNGKGMEAY